MNNNIFEARFKTQSGWLCLDFANTVDWHSGANPEEKLGSYRDLVKWSEEKAIVSSDDAEKLITASQKEPYPAQKTLEYARELREAIYRILSGYVHHTQIKAADLSVFNKAVEKLLPYLKLASKREFEWEWNITGAHLDSVLAPIVWSAIGLMTSEAIERVGQCADENCGWLFWDTSRNRTRRWCDMKDCGNRAKSRRHYRKEHSKSAG